MKLTTNQESILLKGLSSNVLQMNCPNLTLVNEMLKDYGLVITDLESVDNNCYTGEEVKRALLMCVIMGKGLGKKENDSFGDRVDEILHYALNHDSAAKALSAMGLKVGKFTLSFAEAIAYLEENPKGLITYENAINGTYVCNSSKYSYFAMRDNTGLHDKMWYHRGYLISTYNQYQDKDKWAIVA